MNIKRLLVKISMLSLMRIIYENRIYMTNVIQLSDVLLNPVGLEGIQGVN